MGRFSRAVRSTPDFRGCSNNCNSPSPVDRFSESSVHNRLRSTVRMRAATRAAARLHAAGGTRAGRARAAACGPLAHRACAPQKSLSHAGLPNSQKKRAHGLASSQRVDGIEQPWAAQGMTRPTRRPIVTSASRVCAGDSWSSFGELAARKRQGKRQGRPAASSVAELHATCAERLPPTLQCSSCTGWCIMLAACSICVR